MAVLSDYTSGTISLAQGSVTVTGTGTLFEVTRFREGDTLQIQNLTAVIASVDSDTSLTLTEPWTGTTIVDGPYRARQLGDISRYPTQAATIIDLLGNGVLTNLAELGVEEGKAPVGGPSGQYELKPVPTDPNGSLAKLAALTLASGDTYVQGDGTLHDKLGLPVSTATNVELDKKFDKAGGNVLGDIKAISSIVGTHYPLGPGLQYASGFKINMGSDIHFLSLVENNPGVSLSGIMQLSSPIGLRNWLYGSDGSLTASGPINGSAKNFELDHTVDPDNYDLRHCATEAPEMLVEYRGIAKLVNGRATVNVEEHYGVMQNTFKNLWADAHVHALQNQDGFARVRPSPVNGANFEIICEDETCSDNVTWLVMARRNDPYVRWKGCTFTDEHGRLIIEFEKPE